MLKLQNQLGIVPSISNEKEEKKEEHKDERVGDNFKKSAV